jgi:hypothetical protein
MNEQSLHRQALLRDITAMASDAGFNAAACALFDYQRRFNKHYAEWLQLIGQFDAQPTHWREIPCAPIGLFKWRSVYTSPEPADQVFKSSGTTGKASSHHAVRHFELFASWSLAAFERHFGPIKNYGVLALLPNYLEQGQSSLVAMTRYFIERCGHAEHSGFFLYDTDTLIESAARIQETGGRVLLMGVSFALLDLALKRPDGLQNALVIETGGMKGRRRELIREELHEVLQTGLGVSGIGSEYGMTELLSQAWAPAAGVFVPNQRMRVYVREATDPFSEAVSNGPLNIVDLANIDSCAFIATDDLGRLHSDNRFEVLGRLDHSDIRGCALMVCR